MEEKIRRIFLCRHGKTEANEQGIYCGGKRESPLNEEGRKQAGLLGKALANYYNFNGKLIITSARKRAIETGKIISQYLEPNPTLLSMEGLRELEIGKWCGKTAIEVKKLFPEKHKTWQEGHLNPDFRFPGGESMKEAQERAKHCLEIIKKIWLGDKKENNNDLIVIAHAGINMMIMSKIMDAEMKIYAYRSFRQDNTCVNIIGFREKNDWRPETQILLVNSTHHFDMDFSKIKSST